MSKTKATQRRRSTVVIDASRIARVQVFLSFLAFLSALCLACLYHYEKVVKNEVAGYPQEWFPSVSATIGDWYPERNIFQILIAVASGPRFLMVGLQYYLTYSNTSNLPTLVFISGVIRTLLCGGWVYITSCDNHDAHDVLMILYIVFNIPWMFGGIALTPRSSGTARRKRVVTATAFFSSLVPMVYFFIQHKVNKVPGAYTHYSFFEWALITLDILYDSAVESDFKEANLQIAFGPSLRNGGGKVGNPTATNPAPTMGQTTTSIDGSEGPVATKESSSEPGGSSSNRSQSPTQWRAMLSFLSDVYLAFIAWSIFTSLGPSLFYFSVWELGIAGQELTLISTLSPVLLAVPLVRAWTRTKPGIVTLHLLSFAGLGAYALEKPIHRLLVITLACVFSGIRQAADWSGESYGNPGPGYQGVLLALSVIFSSLSKHANYSNNPVWPTVNEKSGGHNKTGIILALLALCEFAMRPSHKETSDRKDSTTTTSDLPKGKPSGAWLSSAVTLGSLVFSLHCFLSDSSTLIAWSWTGYTNGNPNGPVPNLHGALTLIAQCMGLLLALSVSSASGSFFAHPLWFLSGSGCAFVLYRYRNWHGYAGGLGLAIFLMSITPQVVHRAALTGHAVKTYFIAWAVVCLFDLAHVWVVAYAFVPGGVYLRERTDLVLIAQMAALAFGFNWPRFKTSSYTVPKTISSYSRVLLAAIPIFSLLATLYHLPSKPLAPFKARSRIVTAGIWTVHFGLDNKGRDSQRSMRNLFEDLQLDIVGLLETDLHRVVFGNRDLTRVIAEEIGYHVDPGPGPNSHTWGAVLLSKFPIINSTHHLLPSPQGELAPAIEAVLDIYGTPVTVVVAHNGQEPDRLDRELQSRELARIMAKSYPQPVIFLGYVVTLPLAPQPAPYDILVSDGRMHDIDITDWDRWCEYILYRGLYRTGYARISRGEVTDTELQVGQFVVPKHGFGITGDTLEARHLRSEKEDLPPDHWFPMEYYNEGKNGHFYHVFNAPLYYKIPKDAIV